MRLFREIQNFAAQPDHAFIFFEIDSDSVFGQRINNLSHAMPSVMYFPVADVTSIREKLGSVLIRYD